MTILFLENKKIFENWASPTYTHKYNAICEDDRFKVIDMDDDFSTLDISMYDTIIFGWHGISINKYYNKDKHNYYSSKVKNLEKANDIEKKITPLMQIKNKLLIVQDMHTHDYYGGIQNLSIYLEKHNFNKIISPYLNTSTIEELKKFNNNIKIEWLPHCINENLFKDWKSEKVYDILLFGNDHAKYYPFRNRVINILNNTDKFIVYHIPKIKNYFRINSVIANDKLSKFINKSWLTLCTSSKYDFLLGKYFETSMSNSTILGNMPHDGLNIWNNNYIKITPSMSDNQIISTIESALKDKNKLLEIANNNCENMKEYYLSNYTNKLFKTCNKKKIIVTDHSYDHDIFDFGEIKQINITKLSKSSNDIATDIHKLTNINYDIIIYNLDNTILTSNYYFPFNVQIYYYNAKITNDHNRLLLRKNIHIIPYIHDALTKFKYEPKRKIVSEKNITKKNNPNEFILKKLWQSYKKKRNNNIVFLNENNNNIFNGHLATFVDITNNPSYYTLCKIFTVCVSGSLLVIPFSDMQYIKQYGFVNGKNCICINTTENLELYIKYIINPNNKNKIDGIRKNGYDLIINFIMKPIDNIFRNI